MPQAEWMQGNTW